ncbi:MAG TPA: YcjF family protein, partial [Allocoleopsis sp.]
KRGIDIISISANPQPIKVRKEQENNTFEEWLEQPETDLTPLIMRMNEIFSQVGEKLILSTNWRATLNLKHDAKTVLNQIRKEKALPIIEQYQWIAAGTSFANPIIALDLLANVAINGQMIIDLGEIYQQKLSLEQGKTAARTLGETMLKLGLVELSTNTIGHLLKTNAITYIAGGLTQGISAAYLTRVAGLSLIEYFQTQEISDNSNWNWDKLSVTIKSIFEQNQRIEFLQNFVKQVAGKILPQYS